MATLYQVFCKTPIAGKVKSRLRLCDGKALAIHLELADRAIGILPKQQVEVWCFPSLDHEYLRRLREEGYATFLQQGRDLGERMAASISDGLHRGCPVVLFGIDCPLIDRGYLERAALALETHDVVIGPAEDGGYGLIGMNSPHPELFRDITWGGPRVREDTCRLMCRLGLSFHLLPLIWDVDRPEDLRRYAAWKQGKL